MHALPSLSLRTALTGGIGIEITCTRDTRHAHTHHHDTTGPEGGDCMLVGGCCGIETPRGTQPPPTHANCRKPALERLAHHSLFGRYMARWRPSKTRQKRIKF